MTVDGEFMKLLRQS